MERGALQFANVEAEIVGTDIGWRYSVSDRVVLDGNAAILDGRRTDVSDKLYRLSPANASIALNLINKLSSVRVEWVGFSSQEDVSAYNDETPSAGYGIVNALWAWQPTRQLRLELQATNLLDKGYQVHTAGINRVTNSDISGRRALVRGRKKPDVRGHAPVRVVPQSPRRAAAPARLVSSWQPMFVRSSVELLTGSSCFRGVPDSAYSSLVYTDSGP